MKTPGPHAMTAQAGAVASLAERRALNKALDALDALSEAWAEEVNLTALCANLAKAADVPTAIYAMAVQAWVEGAYAGRTSHATSPATIPAEAVMRLVDRMGKVAGPYDEPAYRAATLRWRDELTQLIKERSNG